MAALLRPDWAASEDALSPKSARALFRMHARPLVMAERARLRAIMTFPSRPQAAKCLKLGDFVVIWSRTA